MSRTFAVYGDEGFDPGPEAIPEGWRIVEGAVWVPRPVTMPERLPLYTGGIEVLWSIQVIRGPSGVRNEAPAQTLSAEVENPDPAEGRTVQATPDQIRASIEAAPSGVWRWEEMAPGIERLVCLDGWMAALVLWAWDKDKDARHIFTLNPAGDIFVHSVEGAISLSEAKRVASGSLGDGWGVVVLGQPLDARSKAAALQPQTISEQGAPDDREAEEEWRYTAVEPHLPWTHAWALHTGDVTEAPVVVVTGRVRNGGKVQVKTLERHRGGERPVETKRPEAPTLREALLREALRYTVHLSTRVHIPDVVDTLDQQAQEETAGR